jgi:hypothetical protein
VGKRCRRGIWVDDDVNTADLLQKPEDRILADGTALALAFADSTKITFTNFDLAVEQFLRTQGQLLENDLAQYVEKQDHRVAVHVPSSAAENAVNH